MHTQAYFLFLNIIYIVGAQKQEDDGKYRPDAIPVWEHERQDYTFSYGVKDLNTGDVKNQWEKKVGDTIHGHYTVLEPDGSLRIVHYTADDKNGFNAVVKHEGPSYHPVTVSSSHNQMQVATSKPRYETKNLPKPQPEPTELLLDDTQSVNIEPETEMEAIDAYLYIPSKHQDLSDIKVTQYELVSDDQYHHFANYDADNVHKNHKSVYTNIQPNIKIKTAQRAQPISYDLLTPVTIDLTKINLDNYEQAVFDEPEIENGFRPVPKKKATEPSHIPNTFTTNKKPITTPGLKSYASNQRPHLRGPVTFPKRIDKDKFIQYSNVKGKTTGLRYTKHVTYFPDDY